MTAPYDIKALNERIQQLRKAAVALSDMGDDFPAVKRNSVRILSSIKMLEINVSDVLELSTTEQ
jgi:hypothetical protein